MSRLLLGIVALVLATSPVQQVDHERARRDAEWLDQFVGRAYGALMPLDVLALRAAYRREDNNRRGEIEQYFAIRLSHASRDLEATVVVPVGGAITRQLLNQYHRDYKASFESILAQVSVRRFSLNSVACPAVRSRMSALSKINIRLQDDNLLRLDATVYRLAVWFSAGQVDASIYDEQHSLVRWATETHEALTACGTSKSQAGH